MSRSELIPRMLFEPSLKEGKFAAKFFSGPCTLLKSAFNPEGIPKEHANSLPEVAFLGRSNVGKSSLINRLLGQKLAIASKKPGRTRSLNFYLVNRKLTFVDMPGYGYGTRSYFSSLVDSYLINRRSIRSCCLLVDSVVGALKSDWLMAEALDAYQIPYQVVLTKVDKLREAHVQRVVFEVTKAIQEGSAQAFPQVFPVSVKANTGINLLQCYLLSNAGLLRPGMHPIRLHHQSIEESSNFAECDPNFALSRQCHVNVRYSDCLRTAF